MKLTSTQKRVLRQVNGGEVYYHPVWQTKKWSDAVRVCVKKGLIELDKENKAFFTEKGLEILNEAYRS